MCDHETEACGMTTFDNDNKVFIAELFETLTTDRRVLELLSYCLGRVLVNDAKRRGGPVIAPTAEVAMHIQDWLAAAVANGEHWLANVDTVGRPKKLLKFADVAAIVKEADKAMERFARHASATILDEGAEAVEMEFDDGWAVVRLLTPEALDKESAAMQHCIGQGAYDEKLAGGRHLYLSLRDPFGKAHATMELIGQGKAISQLRGKQNEEPLPRYIDRMMVFLKAIGGAPRQLSPDSRWVFDTDGNRHDLQALPDGVTLSGDIRIDTRDISLPSTLAIEGGLHIQWSNVTMPTALEVGGDLSVKGSALTGVPVRLSVSLGLFYEKVDCEAVCDQIDLGLGFVLAHCSVERLPRGLIDTVVSIENCPRLTGIDELSRVDCLHLRSNAGITALPDGLKITSFLDVQKTPISEFPVNVEIGGSITLAGVNLLALPENLHVRGSLSIQDNPISALPEGLTIDKGFTFANTAIRRIPRSATIQGPIWASNTPLETLEGIAFVGGNLKIDNTKVTELPDGLRVGGNLDASSCPLSRIGDRVKVSGVLSINKTDVEHLPPDLEVAALEASYCSLSSLPEGFRVPYDLNIAGSDIRTLPDKLWVGGRLDITETRIETLPHGLHVTGDFVFVGAAVRDIPSDAVINGRLLGAGAKLIRAGAAPRTP
jgi:hypothetical protein